MMNNLMQLLSYCVPSAQQSFYMGLLVTYVDLTASAAMRAAAYQAMWRMIASGITSQAVQMAFTFGRAALAAAGAGVDVIMGAYAAIAAFLAGTGGMVVLIILVALLLLIIAWFVYEWWKQNRQQQQIQQNQQLQQSTQKLLQGSLMPFQTLANDPSTGPMYAIVYQQLQPGCTVG
jgi:hypothetical protein